MSSQNVKYIPKDAQVIMAILKELGINDFDPRVINQLLEFIYWHTTIILDDARVFANHAKKKTIDVDDVKLAIQMHAEQMTSAGPPRDVLLELARSKNSTSLPPIKPQSGIRLPPDRYCLSQSNYKLKSNLKNTKKVINSTATTNGITHDNIKFSTTPVLKQMPMIPRNDPSSPNLMSKDISSDSHSATDILMARRASSNQISGIKTETDIDLMEIDAITDHI
ncbi:transcription initiation factor TFIID subunit 9-like [Planococcus citri]|uniref:transcription initiation factor TFIID subunit 9-like n=1 Tax=Planococcus citri TaxID=170843 RepID=UPI0031F74FD0